MGQNWYVLMTKVRQEERAIEEIKQLECPDLETFLPIETIRRQDRSKKARPIITVERPLIRGYVFLRFDTSQPSGWQKIARLQPVRAFLKSSPASEHPSPIRTSWVDQLKLELVAMRAALANNQAIKLEPLPDGVRVTIKEGPFATFGGIVSLSHGERVKVMLDAAGFGGIDIERRFVETA